MFFSHFLKKKDKPIFEPKFSAGFSQFQNLSQQREESGLKIGFKKEQKKPLKINNQKQVLYFFISSFLLELVLLFVPTKKKTI